MKLLATLLVCLSVNPQVDTVHLDRGIYIGQLPAGTGKLYDNGRGLFLGRYFMSTGAVICGVFSNGRADGRDTLFYPDGRVFIGIMRNNGPTQYGRTYKNARAAGFVKPVFPEVDLDEEDMAFLDSFGNGEYDTPAVFRDGTSFFQSYIVPNFHFSESMYNSWAIVHYEFVVGADGKIRDVTILSTTNEEYSKELVKVIRRSPRWHPAMKDGRPVPYTVRKQKAAFNMPQ